jgi:hypothetical protein
MHLELLARRSKLGVQAVAEPGDKAQKTECSCVAP